VMDKKLELRRAGVVFVRERERRPVGR
jgi:hypothetical protein